MQAKSHKQQKIPKKNCILLPCFQTSTAPRFDLIISHEAKCFLVFYALQDEKNKAG